MSKEISRRDVLAGVGTGLGTATLGTRGVGAKPPKRHVVGTRTKAAAEAAERAADAVSRSLDFGGVGRAVAGEFPEEALAGLRRRPDVRYVEPDGQYRAIGETLPWGIDRVDADAAHAAGETGGDEEGADVAIVDTGIDDDHPDLRANVGEGRAFVDCEGSNCNYAWSDDNDHGTHCAGVAGAASDGDGVVGVSTAATLHAVKVLDADGVGYWSDVAAGIEWVADRGYDVANVSLGGSTASSVVRDACRYAYERGVLIVAAAGNDGPCSDCVNYPAKYDTVVAVSATSSDDSLADFSTTGPEIELAAPGERIYSTLIDRHGTYSGTSMASPHVAGAAGQLADDGYSNVEARRRLRETAEDVGLADDEQGAGLLDVEAAVPEDSADADDEAPTVSWAAPSDGDRVTGTATVRIDAADPEDADGDLAVEYRVDGGSWRTAAYDSTSGYYEDSWDSTTVADGDSALEARAEDGAGNASSTGIGVTVDNTDAAPTVSWAAPDDGDAVSGTAAIRIDAADAEDADDSLVVEWRADGGAWRTASYDSASGYYEDSWDTTGAADGDHVLDARATDSNGNASADERIAVTVDNAAGEPTIERYDVSEAGSPNPHAEIAVDWAVRDADGDLDRVVVEVIDETGSVVDAVARDASGAAASGSEEFAIKHSRDERFDVTLTAADAEGRTASETRTVSE